jgi:hypothetical protein
MTNSAMKCQFNGPLTGWLTPSNFFPRKIHDPPRFHQVHPNTGRRDLALDVRDRSEGRDMISREELLTQLRATPSSLNDAMLTMEVAADFITRHAQGAPNRGALLELLSNAYNEGFGEGMREHSSSKSGWPWNSRKQKYSALLDKALSTVTSTPAEPAQRAPWQPIETVPFVSAKRYLIVQSDVTFIGFRYYPDGPWYDEHGHTVRPIVWQEIPSYTLTSTLGQGIEKTEGGAS